MNEGHQGRQKVFFFSIKARIALLCICSILLSVFVTFHNMATESKKIITKSTERTLMDLADTYSKNLSNTISQLSRSANFMMTSSAIKTFVESGGTVNDAEVANLATMFLNSQTSYEDVSIADANGKVLYSSNSSMTGTDLSGESYFEKMVESGLSTQGNLYISETSGEPCVTFAIPLRTDMAIIGDLRERSTNNRLTGKEEPAGNMAGSGARMKNIGDKEEAVENFTGAIIVSVNVSAFDKVMSDVRVADYKTGYAYILDTDGNFIYHTDESLIGSKIDAEEINELLENIKNGELPESDIITYTYNNIKKYAGFKVNNENQWVIIVGAEESEVIKSLHQLTSDTILTTAVLVLILSILAYFVTRRIANAIKKVTNLINKTADFDFTSDNTGSNLFSRNDEIGEISRAIGVMRSKLKDMLLDISKVSAQIVQSADNLSSVSNSVNRNACENSATAQELSAGMEETVATTQQINDSIEMIKGSSKVIADKITVGTKMSENIINRAEALKNATMDATEKIHKIYEEVKTKTDEAIERSKAVEKIGTFTETIKEIADQTNLLALNASIEAARSGDAGRGFSVVANEIRELANQSAKTVSYITETVGEVYQAVDSMSTSLEQILDFLEKNVLSDYRSFLNSSTKYNEDAKIMSRTMEHIKKQIEQLNDNVLGIAGSISEINTMISEASAGVNDVAEKNTDIVALTEKTFNMSNENKEIANKLKDIFNRFKL